MMSICNTQKMQQHSNKQGDTVTEKKTSTSYFGSGNLNFWQTGKNTSGSGSSSMQNALSSYNNNSSQNQNNKQASSSSSVNKSISSSLKNANDKAKSAVKTNISDALAKYGAGH